MSGWVALKPSQQELQNLAIHFLSRHSALSLSPKLPHSPLFASSSVLSFCRSSIAASILSLAPVALRRRCSTIQLHRRTTRLQINVALLSSATTALAFHPCSTSHATLPPDGMTARCDHSLPQWLPREARPMRSLCKCSTPFYCCIHIIPFFFGFPLWEQCLGVPVLPGWNFATLVPTQEWPSQPFNAVQWLACTRTNFRTLS